MGKVYFIYGSYRPNNAATNRALAYLKALSSFDYSVTVLYLMPDNHFSKWENELPNIKVEYCWEKKYINIKYLKNLSYIVYLYEIYKRVKSGDIVYLYGGVDLMEVLHHKKGVRLFHEKTEHPLTHPPVGRLFHPSIKRYLYLCSKVEKIFVISTCLKNYYIQNGIATENVVIVNTIVDTTRFEGVKKENGERYFAYCGNGNNKKDKVDNLIKVFSHVAERHTNINFVIIGPIKQVYKDEQDNVLLAKQLGLEDRIIFTGMKPASEIPQMMVNAEALFLTRPDTLQNRAGFSTKLGEYLASGNPVVVASVGDIPLFLKDRVNAFVYEPGNLKAVEEAMEFILANPKDSNLIGASGKEVALKCFNTFTETKKLVDAFSEQK